MPAPPAKLMATTVFAESNKARERFNLEKEEMKASPLNNMVHQ
jgi:uncharacterized membrane protein